MMKKKNMIFELDRLIKCNTGKKILYYFCSFVPVGLEDYVEFFRKNFRQFVYMKLRFPHSMDRKINSELKIFVNGNLYLNKKLYNLRMSYNKVIYFLMLPIYYIITFLQICFVFSNISRQSNSKYKIYMGINYFTTMAGVFLKKFGYVDFVIYRVMDFFPLPPSGIYRILNRIFYIIDKYCLKNSDYIWFTTKAHIEGRLKYGYRNNLWSNYLFIPLGINIQEFRKSFSYNFNPYSLIYCGVISRYHLLDVIFNVVNKLKLKYPNIVLHIIGDGPDYKYYEETINKMQMNNNIIMHGFISEREQFKKLIVNSLVGFALYRDEENFIKYTEPAKVKTYLSFGVPVIVSDVPEISREVEKYQIGFCVENDEDLIVDVVEKFINNPKLQKDFKENIQKFVYQVDIESLLFNSFRSTFQLSEKKGC